MRTSDIDVYITYLERKVETLQQENEQLRRESSERLSTLIALQARNSQLQLLHALNVVAKIADQG